MNYVGDTCQVGKYRPHESPIHPHVHRYSWAMTINTRILAMDFSFTCIDLHTTIKEAHQGYLAEFTTDVQTLNPPRGPLQTDFGHSPTIFWISSHQTLLDPPLLLFININKYYINIFICINIHLSLRTATLGREA